MLRTSAALAVTAAMLGFGAPAAGAQPQPEACTYRLSAPTVVNVSGTDMVTATVGVGACDGAVTFQTTACIAMEGTEGPGQCAQGRGILPAQVFFQPYRPGATYTATGSGCATKGNPPQKYCVTTGPATTTL